MQLFNGQRKNWISFQRNIETQLRLKNISYLLKQELIDAKTRQPDMPNLADEMLFENLTPAQITIKKKSMQQLHSEKTLYAFRNEQKLFDDYDIHLGIIESLLTDDIKPHLSIITTNHALTTKEKIQQVTSYLQQTYGPNDSNDVENLKNEIREATSEKGYHKLLTIHSDCIQQINSIPQKANNGEILKDPVTNQTIFHTMTDNELKYILISQLQNSDFSMRQLKNDAIRNPDLTYTEMRNQIINMVKNSTKLD